MGERTADEMLPLDAVLDERTVLRDGGVQIRVWQISGLPWELETNGAIMRLHDRLNAMMRNLADPRLTLYTHICKLGESDTPDGGLVEGFWPATLDRDYREKVLGCRLSRNVIYVSLAYEGGARLGRRAARAFAKKGKRPVANDLRRMDELSGMLERDLAPYGCLPLGLRAERRPNGVLKWYSQIAEAIGVMLYGVYQRVPVPAPGSRLGHAILRHRPVFVKGARSFEVRLPGATSRAKYFGAMFGFTAMPEGMEPGILDNLLDFPGERMPAANLVINCSFGFMSSSDARNKLKVRQGHAKHAGEEEADDEDEIAVARREHHRKEWVLGSSHISIAVYAATLPELDDVCGELNTRLLDTGFHPAMEDLNLDAAWAAQAPGSWHKIARRESFTSRNYAAVAPLHNYAYGDPDPLWGDYVADFVTSGGTLYRHNLHRGEVGSFVLLGLTGAGKSVLANFMLLNSVCRLGARGVMFDKDYGAQPCILGMGGTYLALRYKRPSGLAPLKAALNEPEHHGHLVALFRACILSRAPADFTLSPEERTRLEAGIATQLCMPPELRSWAAVRQVLGWRNPQGAGAYLEPFCEGGDMGWMFANETDEVDLSRRVAGFDTTEILPHPEVCGPILAHLSWRVRRLLTGSPFFLFWDETPQALKIPTFEDMIGDNLAIIRRNNGIVGLASQGPGALLSTKIGPVIREQTPTKISFQNQDASWEEYDAIGFTPVMFRKVTQEFPRDPRQFVVSRAGASVVCRFDLSVIRQHLWMLSGRATTRPLLERLYAEHGGDPEKWVPLYMEQAPKEHARMTRENAARHAAEIAGRRIEREEELV